MKKKNTEEYGMKKKLTAAVAMLLVATIMMVSTTYAWFTLSTAPEVKGITTTIGANGNLEIALSPADGDGTKISSAAGDSMAVNTKVWANATWGNLVDLSDNAYGLSKITLMPAALNASAMSWEKTDSGYVPTFGTLQTSLLLTPSYGTDGRVANLLPNTSTGVYDAEATVFPVSNAKGVRAIGVASAMTERQLTYRNSVSEMKQAISDAQRIVRTSLYNRGGDLASAGILHATSTPDENNYKAVVKDAGTANEKTVNYVQVVGNVIDDLTNVQTQIEAALVAGVKGFAASKNGNVALYSAIKSDTTLDAILDKFTENGVTVPAELTAAQTAFNALKANISAASSAYDGIKDNETVGWDDFEPVLEKIMNPNAITVNGWTPSEMKNHVSELAGIAMKGGMTVDIGADGGIYADIAKICGDYTAMVSIDVNYNGIELTDLPVTLKTNSIGTGKDQVETATTDVISSVVTVAGAPEAEAADGPQNVDDTFGYMLDFFFRTNAADSNLLLQTEATNRIYEESTEEEIMGSGSTMSFTTTDAAFAKSGSMKTLMEALRLVFVDKDGKILNYAQLDMRDGKYETSESGDSITAKLYINKPTRTEKVTPATEEGEEDTVEFIDTWTLQDGSTGNDDNVITALSQNTATAVSVIVYLDGDKVDNGDVANGLTSMTGTLNLQFASSATLVPMVDTGLMGVTTAPATPEEP